MQTLIETNCVDKTPATDNDLANEDASVVTRARQCLHRQEVLECMYISEWAKTAENPAATAIPALCALLKRPRRRKALRVWHERQWIEMRLCAIAALRHIGMERHESASAAAIPLASSLMYDVPEVRHHCRAALVALEIASVGPLIENLRTCRDWPLAGMLETIDTLRQLKHKSAGPALTRVLFGLLPETSDRWFKCQFDWSMRLGLSASAGCLLFMLSGPRQDNFEMLWLVFIGIIMAVGYSALFNLPVGAWIMHCRQQEAGRLHAAAADALDAIKDVRSVPSLIEVATGNYSLTAKSCAARALSTTLGEIRSEHQRMLDEHAERRLTSLFTTHGGELILAAVRALEFVGTGQSVAPLDRLIRRRPAHFDAGMLMETRIEAERILPILLERRRREEATSTLLRPSNEVNCDPLLLRPIATASSVTQNQTSELLRPAPDTV